MLSVVIALCAANELRQAPPAGAGPWHRFEPETEEGGAPLPLPRAADFTAEEVVKGDAAAAPQPLGRKQAAADLQVRLRDQDWSADRALSRQVLREALLDPFALASLALLLAYVGIAKLMPRKSAAAASAPLDGSRRKRTDRFALTVNQRLVKLGSVDEVLDFALESAKTGRTDIVNAVTAIHRSAKLASALPPHERGRYGGDVRLRGLLDQLSGFLAQRQPPGLLSRAVGNTSWALAKLEFRQDPAQPHAILAQLAELFVAHAPTFKPEELMNAVWAFGELRRDKGSDNEARALDVAEAAVTCGADLADFTLQQLVYFAWALARLSSIGALRQDGTALRAGVLGHLRQVVARVRPELRALLPKNFAMLAWAVAALLANLGLLEQAHGDAQSLLAEIAAIATQRCLGGFKPGEVASVLWAVNKAHVPAPHFYAFLRAHLLKLGLDGFNSQDIATILCAFVKTGHGSDALYELLSRKAAKSAKDFSRSEKMMMSWAFSQLPHLAAPEL